MYQEKFANIINFCQRYMGNHYWSYTDYHPLCDWAGGGMTFSIQWDDNDVLEDHLIKSLEDYFYGVTASASWGKWNHQIYVHVDEKACR